MPLDRTVRRPEQVLGEVRREAAQLGSFEHMGLESGLGLDRLLVVQEPELALGVSATIRPPVRWMSSEPSSSVSSVVPEPRRLEQ